ncbi:MAG TPA: tetratricopeptide repeat protein, partial [Verrucomicrobiae bacterium]|nr:tetratricopeptide repeat protein [Verrucomicrobiae bacterium]
MAQFRSSRFSSLVFAALAFALFSLFCGRVDAASRGETNSWNEIRDLASDVAVSPTLWGTVENKCELFIKKYAQSDYVPDVLAVEAKAMFKQQKWDAVIAKFSNGPTNAVKVADKLAYWTARSYFEKNNYRAAAENFARLGREHPSSTLRLESIYRECECYAKLDEWQRVIEELRESNGAFQQLAKANANDQWVVSGLLLLGEAELARKDPKDIAEARKTLSGIAPQPTRPELEWERQFLLCRAELESNAVKEALRATTNLLAAATGNVEWRAKSVILKGEIYERVGQIADAAQTYQANLNGDLPASTRQQALIRMVELTLRQDKTDEAAQQLEDYLAKYPGEKGSDFEWLMLGELTLKKDFLAPQTGPAVSPAGKGTNLLQQAEEYFQKVKGFTNSPYLGKAELDLGWCYTKDGKMPESLGAFSNALEHLPFSEDQAVARFKLADTLFLQGNFAAAMTNYSEIINRYSLLPGVKNELFEQTLYQLVRACLNQSNSPEAEVAATNAMREILAWFPEKMLADRSLLLYGQSQNPSEARKVFSDLAARYPKSSLLPEVKLAVARTYEKERNWPNAL